MRDSRFFSLWVCLLVALFGVSAMGAVALTHSTAPINAASKKIDGAKRSPNQKAQTTQQDSEEPKPESRLMAHLRLSGSITESAEDVSLFSGDRTTTVHDWMQRLRKAQLDDRIDMVALEIDMVGLSASSALELAAAIERLDAVKPVYTFLTVGGFPQYLVASAGRKIYMEPTGELPIVGMAIEMGFYKGVMDKWGVTPQFVQAGKYKGASEPYMNTEPSKELAHEIDQLIDDMYTQVCKAIASHRNLSIREVQAAIDEGPLRAATAKRLKLVDELVTYSDWMGKLASLDEGHALRMIRDYGKQKAEQLPSNPLTLLNSIMAGPKPLSVKENTIAIIAAEGVITTGSSGSSLFGGKVIGHTTLAKAFKQARDEPNIKAVLLRINSPGGSALASELIYQAVKDCAEKKPVIVSISGMGASGGYYIAMGGDMVYADPMAIVGSIGVVAGRVSFDGFLEGQRYKTHAWTRGRNAGLNLSRPWTPSEMEVIRHHVDKTYLQFTSRVANARGRKIKNIEEVAQGRIFCAGRARKLGLIDKIGGLREALAEAVKKGKIEGDPNYLVLPQPKSLIEMLTGENAQASVASQLSGSTNLQQTLGALIGGIADTYQLDKLRYLLQTAEVLNSESMMMALPYHLQVRY